MSEHSTGLSLLDGEGGRGWSPTAVRLPDDEHLTVRFEHAESGSWLEVELVPRGDRGRVLRRLERCAVRYRGELSGADADLKREAGELVMGFAAQIDGRLLALPEGASLADALGARREPGVLVFSRDALRSLIAPEIQEGLPLPGGFSLADVYPTSHVNEQAGGRLSLVLEFRREDGRRFLITVGPRDEGRRGFAHTEHFTLSYLTLGGPEPEGAPAVRMQVELALRLRDHAGLEVRFPDMLADVAAPALAGVEAHEALVPAERLARRDEALNLAISSDCHQACTFCSVRDTAPAFDRGEADLPRYLADVREAVRRGVRRLRLNGYDPLQYSRVLDVLRFARDEGIEEVDVFSPCTRLADRAFFDALVEALPGRRTFYVPLYALEAGAHDAVVGTPGAHVQVMRALEHLEAGVGGAAILILTAVSRLGLPHLLAVRDHALDRGWRFAAHMPYPSTESRSDAYFEAVPRMSEVVDTLAPTWAEPLARPPFFVRGVAPCVTMRRLGQREVSLEQWLHLDEHTAVLPGAEYRDEAKFSHGAGEREQGAFSVATVACPHAEGCALREACGGELLRAYVDRHGWDEIAPVGLVELLAHARGGGIDRKPARSHARRERAEVEALLPELEVAVREALEQGELAGPEGWRLIRARTHEYDRWEVDLSLAGAGPEGQARTLGLLVHPLAEPDDLPVYARTERHAVTYYSDDLPESRHDELFARDGVTVDRFVAWLRAYEASAGVSAEDEGS